MLHNDDTSMAVLSLRREIDGEADEAERTGNLYQRDCLDARGPEDCAVLHGSPTRRRRSPRCIKERAKAMKPPIQMCDALARNLPKMPETLEVIVGHRLACQATVCRGHTQLPGRLQAGFGGAW